MTTPMLYLNRIYIYNEFEEFLFKEETVSKFCHITGISTIPAEYVVSKVAAKNVPYSPLNVCIIQHIDIPLLKHPFFKSRLARTNNE